MQLPSAIDPPPPSVPGSPYSQTYEAISGLQSLTPPYNVPNRRLPFDPLKGPLNWQYSPLKLRHPRLMQDWSALSAFCAIGYELAY